MYRGAMCSAPGSAPVQGTNKQHSGDSDVILGISCLQETSEAVEGGRRLDVMLYSCLSFKPVMDQRAKEKQGMKKLQMIDSWPVDAPRVYFKSTS